MKSLIVKIWIVISVLALELGLGGQAVVGCAARVSKDAHINSEQSAMMGYRLPIIMYHSTFFKRPGRYNVPPEQLERDLIYIKEKGFETVTVADLIAFKENDRALPQRPIMITFDDGYLNNYLYAYPLFLKHKLRCVMSVVGELTDLNYGKNDEKIMPLHAHLNYEQIKEMSESGYVEIQNHTDKLHSLKKNCDIQKSSGETVSDYEKRLQNDILSMHEKLKNRSGVVCSAVAYPFGSYSKSLSAKILEKIGYKCSFTCAERVNIITKYDSLFNLCRFNRPYGKSSSAFFDRIFKEC